MMNEKSLLSQPAGMISKCKQTQAITIMKLIFDTADAKKLMKGILVLRLACVRHSYMQLQFTAIYLAKVCSLKFLHICSSMFSRGAKSLLYLRSTTRFAKSFHTDNTTSLNIILVPKRHLS